MKTTTSRGKPQLRKGGLALTCRPNDPHAPRPLVVRLLRFTRATSLTIDGNRWEADTPQDGWIVESLGSPFILGFETGQKAVYHPSKLVPLDALGVEDERADEAPIAHPTARA